MTWLWYVLCCTLQCEDLLFTAREMLKSTIGFHNSKLVSIPDKERPVSPLAHVSGVKITEEQECKIEEVNKKFDKMLYLQAV